MTSGATSYGTGFAVAYRLTLFAVHPHAVADVLHR